MKTAYNKSFVWDKHRSMGSDSIDFDFDRPHRVRVLVTVNQQHFATDLKSIESDPIDFSARPWDGTTRKYSGACWEFLRKNLTV